MNSALEASLREQFGPEPSVEFDPSVRAHWGAWRGVLEAAPVIAPGSIEELAEVVHLARQRRATILPCGLGTRLAWHPPPGAVHLLVSTQRLRGIVAHVPADGTISAWAGTRLEDLRASARAHGHFLSPDGAHPERTTLGGTVALGVSGADRLRFGPLRNQILGARVMLGDGRVVQCGGQLVKNVTGYDLHRLYCGSRGRLCIILQVALRLAPEPESEAVLEALAPEASSTLHMSRALLELPIKAVSLVATRSQEAGSAGPWRLSLRLFGAAAGVRHEVELALRAWPAATVLQGEPARQRSAALRDQDVCAAGQIGALATCTPSSLPRVWAEVEAWLRAHELASPVRMEPGLAAIEFQVLSNAGRDPAAALAALRSRLDLLSASLVLRRAKLSPDFAPTKDGEQSPALKLSRKIQTALDPNGVFAPWN